jgi:hypothetical protein
MLWMRVPSGGKEAIAEDVDGAQLIVASQDCDIIASSQSEPRVEALTARWTSDRSAVHTARKGNSTRLFLIREAAGKALVADARRRVHFEKEGLLGTVFTPAFDDDRTRLRFIRWIAERYDRPAIDEQFVNAIQKPLIKALERLEASDNTLAKVFTRVAELRFIPPSGQPPWSVDLIAMVDEAEELTPEEEAELGGWLEESIVTEGGLVQEIRLAFRGEDTISLRDYLGTMRLRLDQFSPE